MLLFAQRKCRPTRTRQTAKNRSHQSGKSAEKDVPRRPAVPRTLTGKTQN
jgi:hypothetical protein